MVRCASCDVKGRYRHGVRDHVGVESHDRRVPALSSSPICSALEQLQDLPPTEWRILEILLTRPGQLVGSVQILTSVWGTGFQQRTNYLRFHMARLRQKLEDDPARPRHLLTEPGMGYRYQP
jgi:DNA-binding response OmpR family regulator